jgi:shikimate kinase
MGAGKTTVGRLLARRLGYRFEDMDRHVEQATGRSIPEIFREDGEEAFRAFEREAARELAATTRCVVATGGGAFTRPDTRALLQHGATTVWLRCDLEVVLSRLADDGSRPLAGNRDIMRALLAERETSYGMADVTVDGTGPAEDVTDRVLALLRGRAGGGRR